MGISCHRGWGEGAAVRRAVRPRGVLWCWRKGCVVLACYCPPSGDTSPLPSGTFCLKSRTEIEYLEDPCKSLVIRHQA